MLRPVRVFDTTDLDFCWNQHLGRRRLCASLDSARAIATMAICRRTSASGRQARVGGEERGQPASSRALMAGRRGRPKTSELLFFSLLKRFTERRCLPDLTVTRARIKRPSSDRRKPWPVDRRRAAPFMLTFGIISAIRKLRMSKIP